MRGKEKSHQRLIHRLESLCHPIGKSVANRINMDLSSMEAGASLPRISIFLIILLLALSLLGGACGKKMAPLSTDEVLPGPVREFRLSQEGDSLVLSWLFPKEDQLGRLLTRIQGFRLERAEVKGVQPAPAPPTQFLTVADIDLAYTKAGLVQGESVLYQDRDLRPDRRYYYRAAGYDTDRYRGTWSPVLTHAWGLLPRGPRDLKAAPGDKQVRLAWAPVSQFQDGSPLRDLAGYLIYRRSGSSGWLRVTPKPVVQTDFQDVAVLNDVEYTYTLRAVRQVGGDLIESHDSPLQIAMPEDRTPPPPLLNLVVVPTDRGLEARWDPSPAADLAGYRVYRREAGEPTFARLTPQLLTRPYLVDSRVVKGKTYYYYVTAVDDSRRANESLPSEEAAAAY